jgi:chemotaxis signal transduction protein
MDTTISVMVFMLGDLHFGVRLQQVRRVLPAPLLGGTTNGVGVSEIDGQAVTVLDLAQKLFPEQPKALYTYLLLLDSLEPFGILLTASPTISAIPLTRIRQLPASYRRSGPLGLASHVAMIEEENEDLNTFGEEAEEKAPTPAVIRSIFFLDAENLLPLLLPA